MLQHVNQEKIQIKTMKPLRHERRGIKAGHGLNTGIILSMDAIGRRTVLRRSEVYS